MLTPHCLYGCSLSVSSIPQATCPCQPARYPYSGVPTPAYMLYFFIQQYQVSRPRPPRLSPSPCAAHGYTACLACLRWHSASYMPLRLHHQVSTAIHGAGHGWRVGGKSAVLLASAITAATAAAHHHAGFDIYKIFWSLVLWFYFSNTPAKAASMAVATSAIIRRISSFRKIIWHFGIELYIWYAKTAGWNFIPVQCKNF